MAEVINQVGSLSTLKRELQRNGIDQFHSVKDINDFERTYEEQLLAIKKKVRSDLQERLESMAISMDDLKLAIERTTKIAESEFKDRIRLIQDERFALRVHHDRFTFRNWYQYILNLSLRRKTKRILKKMHRYTMSQTSDDRSTLRKLSDRHDDLQDNFEEHYKKTEIAKCHRIWHTKKTIEVLRPTILGTIGENRVASTLSDLPEDYVVINDVKVKLDRPIYNKREDDRILSFQLDHVVIGPSGVFVIETKHWSQESITSRDLFSPVKQIRRSGYALFIIINSAIRNGAIKINDSWGNRSVSIRNIIAFSASSTKKKYDHVKLLEVNSLNGYIEWFERELTASDTKKISSYIEKISN